MENRLPSIYVASLVLFRDEVLGAETGSTDPNSANVLSVVISVMLEQIQMERSGDIIDKSVIKACTSMLESLHKEGEESEDQRLYNVCFEPKFLSASRQFYMDEGERLLRELDAGSFARRTVGRINEEVARCRSTLSDSTGWKIENVVNEVLISEKLPEAIRSDSGVRFMIDNERYTELKDIFELEARIDTRKNHLTKAVQQRIVDLGIEINKSVVLAADAPPAQQDAEATSDKTNKAKPSPGTQHTLAAIKWVQEVLLLKDKFDTLWKMSFKSDQLMQSALSRSFSDFINSTAFNRGSEYISLYMDDNMRKHIKTMTEDEVDQVMQKAITLLKYIQDKDMFERYYKKHLSRRLLMDKSASLEIEKQMVGRMKIELGNTFTSKMEGMFKDMVISSELTANYRDHIAKLGDVDPKRVELKLHILTTMTWPTEIMERLSTDIMDGTVHMVSYPPEIELVKASFEAFYAQKHSGRRLTWLSNMGTADLRARLPSKKAGKVSQVFEYNVSTYAMLVLLLFNDVPAGESLSFEEIQARTNVPESELVRNLQSLAVAPTTRILRKEPMSRDVKATDKFFFNENFQPRSMKVKVGVVAAGSRVETDRERSETEKKNDGNRQYVIEAAIVRIMKCVNFRILLIDATANYDSRQRKTLEHSKLIAETISQLNHTFKPDVPMIKGRIESLIEREYLERVDNANPPAYRYLA